jgi:hypothetical protein
MGRLEPLLLGVSVGVFSQTRRQRLLLQMGWTYGTWEVPATWRRCWWLGRLRTWLKAWTTVCLELLWLVGT